MISMDREEIKNILPHREPMLLVDEAYLNDDGTATGYYTVKGDEYFLCGHFPENPVVPGVILCEIMAQSSCLLFKDKMTDGALPFYTGLDKVKFRNKVLPGDRIKINTKIEREMAPFYFLSGELSVDGKLCMSGRFSFAIMNEQGRE